MVSKDICLKIQTDLNDTLFVTIHGLRQQSAAS